MSPEQRRAMRQAILAANNKKISIDSLIDLFT
jgi:hypothetical protein